jgi:hypothetical protein
MDHAAKAQEHAEIAEKVIGWIKVDKALGRQMDIKDGHNGAVAGAHAMLALYHQREAERA